MQVVVVAVFDVIYWVLIDNSVKIGVFKQEVFFCNEELEVYMIKKFYCNEIILQL